ncbi:MarR family transcriptional regulator, 2-MHQ and catechol-resistance regulon repressor [Deinococcus reticulitermitis]|uniref:MarR family transcriptional regulator, 2-MHQ and catechol-resistance regulon repressor n=1 Tax=Deinococcus reticulitermitis TaxID=856736 RepID=A0A1H6VB00_9DEIO|nr:MarR family transcriptional regulator [Deinococcus reticulitermitis]SEJ01006.1 MarR family transcriptional regulator, 2-MHQ and catechol-resistance regulon repressor [Deinococcus reticulitermitis]
MVNRYVAGTPEEKRALDAYIKLWRASQAAETAAHRHLAQHQLTISQFGVLEAVYHLGPLSQRQLADKILRSSGNLTMVIDNLERDGLVLRQRAKLDRRVMMVNLTPEGQALVETILPQHVAGLRDIFSVLTEQETADLARISRKLGLALAERDQATQGTRRPRRVRPVPAAE